MYSRSSEPVRFERDCQAVLVPQGEAVTLPAGSIGYITQSLGGSFTVFVEGNLMRIAGKDADAIGKTPYSLGLDWFVISLFFSALVFVPLEHYLGKRRISPLRPGWRGTCSPACRPAPMRSGTTAAACKAARVRVPAGPRRR